MSRRSAILAALRAGRHFLVPSFERCHLTLGQLAAIALSSSTRPPCGVGFAAGRTRTIGEGVRPSGAVGAWGSNKSNDHKAVLTILNDGRLDVDGTAGKQELVVCWQRGLGY